jgi:sugar phosphate isomerase/epimerase
VKISVCTGNFGRDNLQRTIAKAAELGFDAVELTVAEQMPVATQEKDRQKVRKWIEEAGIACSATHFIFEKGITLSSPGKEDIDNAVSYIEKVVDITDSVGAKTIIVGGGGIRSFKPGQSKEEAVKSLQEIIARSAIYADKKGVRLAMEALNRYETNFLHTLRETDEFASCVGMPNVKIMGDTFHMNIEEHSLKESILSYGEKLANIHLADSNRLAPGSGHVDFTEVFDALKAINYKAYCSFEVFSIAPGQLYLGDYEYATAEMERGIKHVKSLLASDEIDVEFGRCSK